MRLAFAASALCLVFLTCAVQLAASQTPAPATIAVAASATTPASTSAAAGGDAAAKHAKRTACLQQSKARKLVGADKTAFLKGCIGAPDTISASRIAAPDRP
jgi:hypothetical protein